MRYLHLSLIVPCTLRDRGGERLGRALDLIVRLNGDDFPPLSGALAELAERPVFVPASEIELIGPEGMVLRSTRLDLDRFHRHEQEILLRKDVLDRQLIRHVGVSSCLDRGGGSPRSAGGRGLPSRRRRRAR